MARFTGQQLLPLATPSIIPLTLLAAFRSFSSVLFPPTPADELETLTSGGISPAHGHGPAVSAELRRLLNETSDTLESADCILVRTLCLDRMFAVLVGGMEAPFLSRMGGASEQQGSRFEDVTERTTRLASLLPSVARQSRSVLEDAPNEYLLVRRELISLLGSERAPSTS